MKIIIAGEQDFNNRSVIMELNENTTLSKLSESTWVRIPGTLIQDIQLKDGTSFIKQYGNYDKYEFEILLKKGDD